MPDPHPPVNVIIRPEAPADFVAVAEINTLAFGASGEAQLVAALRQLPGTISLVADRLGQPVGHICFSSAVITGAETDTPVIALAPMAVLPEVQGMGIGSRLVEAGMAACRRAGHRLVVVLGHPWFYPRFGFVPAAPYGIHYPQPVPEEVFMLLELVPDAAKDISGTVRYPSAFSLVD